MSQMILDNTVSEVGIDGSKWGMYQGPTNPWKLTLMDSKRGIASQLTCSSTSCGRNWGHVQNHYG